MSIMTEHKAQIKKERKSFKVNFILDLINGLDKEQYKELTKKIKETR